MAPVGYLNEIGFDVITWIIYNNIFLIFTMLINMAEQNVIQFFDIT